MNEAYTKLQAKRQSMQPFHLQRLLRRGFVPTTHTFASHADPEGQATEAFDAVRRPSFLPPEEFHDAEEAPPGIVRGMGAGVASGASDVSSGVLPFAGPMAQAVGYGVGAAGRTLLGLTLQGARGLAKGLTNASYEHEPVESNETVMAPRRVARPMRPADLPSELPPMPRPVPAGAYEQPMPPYLLDRDTAPSPKRLSFLQKEQNRIKNEAESTGVHPFRPWRTHRG